MDSPVGSLLVGGLVYVKYSPTVRPGTNLLIDPLARLM